MSTPKKPGPCPSCGGEHAHGIAAFGAASGMQLLASVLRVQHHVTRLTITHEHTPDGDTAWTIRGHRTPWWRGRPITATYTAPAGQDERLTNVHILATLARTAGSHVRIVGAGDPS